MAVSYMSELVQLSVFIPNCILIFVVHISSDIQEPLGFILCLFGGTLYYKGQLTFPSLKAACSDLTAFSQSVLSTTKARLSSEEPCAIIITLILFFETDE